MSDKVALVRLRAKNDQYDAAMAKSKKATEDLAASSTRFAGMSDKLGQVGSDLTRGVTLPLALAGAASFKLAKDFGTTFTQMATLAGVPVSELEGLKQSVLDLAGETGQAPAALADSLYQIYSSGVPASEAMNVLRASAQGAALGLGDAAGVANAVTSAMNTYGASELTAAEATDQLTAAVKAGKGEASEFAPQLGNLLPVADMLGISFADTAGSLAFLTRGGSNASAASTKLEGVMRALVKPTQQARDVLEEVGLSADELRAVVAEKGLPAALDLLKEKFGGNLEMMGKFFEDSEGYVGFQALMAEGGREWSKVLQDVNDSQGLVAEGMAILQDTPEFQAQQALADLQATGVELGTALMPIVSELAGGIADLAGVFNDLPTPIQRGLVVLGLFAASLGPMASLLGNGAKGVSLFAAAMNSQKLDGFRLGLMGVTEAGAGTTNMLGGLVAKASASPIALGAVALGAAAVAVALIEMADGAEEANNSAADLLSTVQGGTDLTTAFADKVAATLAGVAGSFDLKGNTNSLKGFTEEFGVTADELSKALLGTEDEYKTFIATLSEGVDNPDILGPLVETLDGMRKAGQLTKEQMASLEAAYGSMGVATDGYGNRVTDAKDKVESFTDALSKQADEILGVLDTHRSAADASEAYNQSIVDVSDAQASEAEAAAAVTTAEQDLAQAHVEAGEKAAENAAAVREAEATLADAYKGREQALRDVEDAQAEANDAAAEVVVVLEELAVAQREATGDSDEYRDAIEKVGDAEEALADRQADSLTAQQELSDARASYSDILAGLARDAGGAADDVLSAEIRLRDAQQALADLGKPDKDGNTKPVSADDKLAAEIAIREAQRRLEEAKINAAEAAAELARNQAAGADGTDAAVAAHGAVASAAEAETDAEQTLADAREGVTTVQEAAAQRVVDAQGRVEDALDNRRDADQRVIDSVGAVEEANGRIASAAAGVETANRNAATATDGVATAQANLDSKKDAHIEAQKAVQDKMGEVETAALDLALALYEEGKTTSATGAVGVLIDRLRDAAAAMAPDSPLRQHILDTADALEDLEGDYAVNIMFATTVADVGAAIALNGMEIVNAAVPGLAKGGPTQAGRTYLVGENGPELWSEGASGFITPASQTAAYLSGTMTPGGGAGSAGIDYDRLAAALATAKGVTVHAPIDARGITNPAALSTVLSARLGMDLALVGTP